MTCRRKAAVTTPSTGSFSTTPPRAARERNESTSNVFVHPIITAQRCHELIELAKKRSQGKLLVSTSLVTLNAPSEAILASADFLLPHGNPVSGPDGPPQSSPHGIRLQVARWRGGAGYRGQPVVYNEDDHFDFDKPDNHSCAIDSGASWGYLTSAIASARDGSSPPSTDDLVGPQARLLRLLKKSPAFSRPGHHCSANGFPDLLAAATSSQPEVATSPSHQKSYAEIEHRVVGAPRPCRRIAGRPWWRH